MNRIRCTVLSMVAASSVMYGMPPCASADERRDEVYSGPQAGEPLSPFVVRQVLGPDAGKDLDPVKAAGDRASLIVFIHDVTRPSMGLTRAVADFAGRRAKDRMPRTIVLLSDDATDAELRVKRMAHALPKEANIAVSLDGLEGPGPLGLNRKVALTILVAKGSEVTANFALIQPSIQVDGPKVAQAILSALGDSTPIKEGELAGERGADIKMAADEVRAILRPLLDKKASDTEVERIAKLIEEKMETQAPLRAEIARITKTIIQSGKLENYGSPAAQQKLREWSKRLNEK